MPREKIDCLFVHVPQDTSDDGTHIMYMAMGVFALADYLHANGYTTRIIHLGVEQIVDNEFSIEGYLRDKDVLSVGISLHWHYQSSDCMKLVNKIKATRPEIKVILGGFTASYFADEIMREFQNVDFVVRGDAETPLLSLIRGISEEKTDFSSIPNLTWRNGNDVLHNKQGYVASEADINNLDFSNFNLMENFDTYSRVPLILYQYSKELLQPYSTFFLCVGRGCPVNCSFCGGSRVSQRIINGRDKVIFRSHESVIKTIKNIAQAGIGCLYVCFDPIPDKKYYIELFRLIRKNRIDISMTFECWSLPTLEFIDEFKKTFRKDKLSRIVLSPDTASERLRRLNTGFFYTNEGLLEVIRYLVSNEIYTDVYFSYPLPHGDRNEVKATKNLIELFKRELQSYGRVSVQDFDLDPVSPMYLCPARYGITKKAESFSDYCNSKERKFLPQGLDDKEFKSVYRRWLKTARKEMRLSKGRAFLTVKQYDEAIRNTNEVIKLAPEELSAYFLLGSCYEQTNRNEDALALYNKALKVFPDESVIYLRLAGAYSTLKHYEEAIKSANRSIELGCEKGSLRILLGLCYEKTQQYAKAIEELTKAEEINPGEYRLYFSLSNCYRKIGQIKQADEALDKGYYSLKVLQK
jgi:radical SAM superfamily enzyme YgiQ (UPF0313 family)